MSKEKTTKQNQSLSPEKYIRQKSRNLPVSECWINEDWEKSRIANIFIARKHANDNLTACIYLVDLGCLGVKDSFYVFNISAPEFTNRITGTEVKLTNISYELAHNIIYSAIEYAEELGFMPCLEFTQTTSFFLEEDTDDIPLIAIKCGGDDGKPLYMNTGHETPARENQILSQLEKAVGEENYNYILNGDDFFR